MNWSSLGEDRLLVLEEEGGGELVEYSGRQECKIWLENGELRHTLFHLFPCPASVLPPPLSSHLLLHLVSGQSRRRCRRRRCSGWFGSCLSRCEEKCFISVELKPL